MRFTARPSGWTLPMVVVVLSLVSAEGVAAKCSPQMAWPGLEVGAPVLLLDGSLRMMDELEDLGPSDIHSIQLTCWNPATGEFDSGVGVPVIRIHTKGLVDATRAPIEGLLRAQEAHFSQHSRYAHNLDDLVAFGVPRDAMVELSVTSAGWSATTPRDGVACRCFVFSGDPPQELAGTEEPEIACQPEAAKANPALREMYEGSAVS